MYKQGVCVCVGGVGWGVELRQSQRSPAIVKGFLHIAPSSEGCPDNGRL